MNRTECLIVWYLRALLLAPHHKRPVPHFNTPGWHYEALAKGKDPATVAERRARRKSRLDMGGFEFGEDGVAPAKKHPPARRRTEAAAAGSSSTESDSGAECGDDDESSSHSSSDSSNKFSAAHSSSSSSSSSSRPGDDSPAGAAVSLGIGVEISQEAFDALQDSPRLPKRPRSPLGDKAADDDADVIVFKHQRITQVLAPDRNVIGLKAWCFCEGHTDVPCTRTRHFRRHGGEAAVRFHLKEWLLAPHFGFCTVVGAAGDALHLGTKVSHMELPTAPIFAGVTEADLDAMDVPASAISRVASRPDAKRARDE